MNKTMRGLTATLIAVLFCGITLAQSPVQDIDSRRHPNLAEAQHHIAEANRAIAAAQKANREGLGGHAEKARRFLDQASQELKEAAEYANTRKHKR